MRINYIQCGINNVWLLSGFKAHQTKYGTSYSYEDIDGLYRAITMALCLGGWSMSPEILRFLRKRLTYSQSQLGSELGCTSQAVAKWEKGTTRIPHTVDRLVRLLCLAKFAPQISLHDAIPSRCTASNLIELEYHDSGWSVAGESREAELAGRGGEYVKFNFNDAGGEAYKNLMEQLSIDSTTRAYPSVRKPMLAVATYESIIGEN